MKYQQCLLSIKVFHKWPGITLNKHSWIVWGVLNFFLSLNLHPNIFGVNRWSENGGSCFDSSMTNMRLSFYKSSLVRTCLTNSESQSVVFYVYHLRSGRPKHESTFTWKFSIGGKNNTNRVFTMNPGTLHFDSQPLCWSLLVASSIIKLIMIFRCYKIKWEINAKFFILWSIT